MVVVAKQAGALEGSSLVAKLRRSVKTVAAIFALEAGTCVVKRTPELKLTAWAPKVEARTEDSPVK